MVELLAVLTLISILGAMTAVAIASARETARRQQTAALITTINVILLEKWDEYAYRPIPLNYRDLGPGGVTLRMPPREAARARLMMLRDLMRMEMPDRYRDFVRTDGQRAQAASIMARVQPIKPDGHPGLPESVAIRWETAAMVELFHSHLTDRANDEHEGAECLYLTLSTLDVDGINALDLLPERSIGDQDADGMLEILDGWDRPIEFIRWPVGHRMAASSSASDPFDPLRTDWGYLGAESEHPIALLPLVVSSGPDGEFNLRFRQTAAKPYQDMVWPLGSLPREESVGRRAPYFYVDPYLRHSRKRGLVGEVLNPESAGHVDNLTNHQPDST